MGRVWKCTVPVGGSKLLTNMCRKKCALRLALILRQTYQDSSCSHVHVTCTMIISAGQTVCWGVRVHWSNPRTVWAALQGNQGKTTPLVPASQTDCWSPTSRLTPGEAAVAVVVTASPVPAPEPLIRHSFHHKTPDSGNIFYMSVIMDFLIYYKPCFIPLQ